METMKELNHVLYYVDSKEPDLVLLERVVAGAKMHGARLTVAAVVEQGGRSAVPLAGKIVDPLALEAELVAARDQQLANALETVDLGDVETEITVLAGHPVRAILEEVQWKGVDFLVKAPAPSDGLRQWFFGSTDMQLMRCCPCPVAVARPSTREGAHRAVACLDYDGDDEAKRRLNDRILDSAVLAQAGEHSEIFVLHAWDLYGYSLLAQGRGKLPPERLREAVERERVARQKWFETRIADHRATLDEEQAARFDPKLELVRGDARQVIPQRVKELDADLVGLGTASRAGVSGLLIGNTAEEILGRVDCSVVVHKPDGFVSPVPPRA
jgi:nucleotide-binding universal stress UspA family protein